MGLFRNLRRFFTVTHSEEHATSPERRQLQDEPAPTRVDSQHSSLASRTARYFRAGQIRFLAKLQPQSPPAGAVEPDAIQRTSTTATYQRYVPICLQGSGGNGEVHLSRDSMSGALVAVKTIRPSNTRSPPQEAQILHFLGQHANIVQFLTVLKHPRREGCMQLIFENCALGDLTDYMDATPGSIPELLIWAAFKQIASGLHYVHGKQVVHGDLKPANVLLAPARHGELYPTFKIADFGTAVMNPPPNIPRGHMSTLGWQPPESPYRFGPECDIWALGCIIYELAARTLPVAKLKTPNVDAKTWFNLSGSIVPPDTQHHAAYKHFCYFMAFHPAAPQRIDTRAMCAGSSVVYSKLLNYMLIRTLDLDYRTRVTTSQLQRYLPVLDTLAYTLTLCGREAMLDKFDDGRDSMWRHIKIVTDSSVFEQVFHVLVLRARRTGNAEMMGWAVPLLDIMALAEVRAVRRWMETLYGPGAPQDNEETLTVVR